MARPLLPLLYLALASCTATYRPLHYAPQPLEAVVQPVGSEETLARVLISVRGIRYDQETGYWLEVRLRVENRSQAELTLARDELLLVDGNLMAFGPPRVEPDEDGAVLADPPVVAPDTSLTLNLSFPFPKPHDAVDLDGLNLKWGVRHADGEEVLSSRFERLGAPSDSGWEVRPTLFFGFGHDD